MNRKRDYLGTWEAILFGLIGIMLLFMVAVGLSGCVTKKACERKFGVAYPAYVTSTTKYVPYKVNVPGGSVSMTLPAWNDAWNTLKDTIIAQATDSAGRYRVVYGIDSAGKPFAGCVGLPYPHFIQAPVTKETAYLPSEPHVPWYLYLIIGAQTAVILALLAFVGYQKLFGNVLRKWFG